MGKSTIQFFKDLDSRLAVRFQDQRESDFLFQRVFLAILRGTPSGEAVEQVDKLHARTVTEVTG